MALKRVEEQHETDMQTIIIGCKLIINETTTSTGNCKLFQFFKTQENGTEQFDQRTPSLLTTPKTLRATRRHSIT
jgi:hypothetical protein